MVVFHLIIRIKLCILSIMRHKFRNISYDKIDYAILESLQNNGRISNNDLANRVGLSPSACLRRVKSLEMSGVIDGYAALVQQSAAGLPDNVFVQITVEKQTKEKLAEFRNQGQGMPPNHGMLPDEW